MKKLFTIFMMAVLTLSAYAQEEAPQAYCLGWLPGYPEHFCECRNTSRTFQFPLETAITDTVWFKTTVNDLKQGMCAYWFSDCTVTMEVYAFCSSKTPTIKMTIGSNQMREMDVADINRRLDEMGDMAELASQVLEPRVKVYPNGGTGTVYCYPYDEGPQSTCSDELPLIPRMTYVCSHTEEVYELKPEKMASTGNGFIRWKQKNNLAGTIRLTADSCNGAEIATVTLTDSTRVLLLDATQMKSLKNAGRSVFVHVTHPADYVGRMYYHNRVIWDEQRIDTTLCQGKSLQLADTMLSQTTVYPNDTLWKRGDTLSLTTYHLTVDTPVAQYDTLRLKAAQLPTTYRNQYIPKDGWGDYDFTIHQNNRCDERYLVHVEHTYVTRETTVDTTICLGKTLTFSNMTYSKDTIIRDSAWANADTWEIRDITIHISEPEMEYDTLSITPSQLGSNGYWYSALGIAVKNYGDTLIVKTKKNTCTRWILLTVLEAEEVITGVLTPSLPSGACKYMRDGVLYIRREGQEYDLLGRPIHSK